MIELLRGLYYNAGVAHSRRHFFLARRPPPRRGRAALGQVGPLSCISASPQGPHRLVVRTSRCGRDNPGSTPGVDNFRTLAGRFSFFFRCPARSIAGIAGRGLCWRATISTLSSRLPRASDRKLPLLRRARLPAL